MYSIVTLLAVQKKRVQLKMRKKRVQTVVLTMMMIAMRRGPMMAGRVVLYTSVKMMKPLHRVFLEQRCLIKISEKR